ncbi:hypothetical protein ACS5NO_04395 [Larkinella sp. GY13]|uniref:hypothetical protein n=1 Tax=Larkinella sp. GY13 TaxID=3453720 RepID=UPI003EE8CDAA
MTQDAIQSADRFSQRFQSLGYGEDQWVLACHAAFAVAMMPDLLYHLWENFRTYPGRDGAGRQIDRIAVSDVLLWPAWRETSPETFELDPDVRAYLLDQLRRDTRFGPQRLTELAHFLKKYIAYATQQDDNRYSATFWEAQSWVADATLNPEETVRAVSEKLDAFVKDKNQPEQLRMRNLIELLVSHDPNFNSLLHVSKGLKAQILRLDDHTIGEQFRQAIETGLSIEAEPGESSIRLLLPKTVEKFIPVPEPPKEVVKPKLLALLVAIDEYRPGLGFEYDNDFSVSRDRVGDLRKLETYLNWDDAFDLHIKTLTNEDATKAEIVRQFWGHLGDAGENDTVLFYFSGYTVYEHADRKVWKETPHGILAGLATYFTDSKRDDFLLSDKEIRYLIHELSRRKPHIITIYANPFPPDSAQSTDPLSEVISTSTIFAARQWDDFIFSSRINPDELVVRGETSLLPIGPHVHLSSSNSSERTRDILNENVLCNALLDVLENFAGDISYVRMQEELQKLTEPHKVLPELFSTDPALLAKPFLHKPKTATKSAFGKLTYANGWRLNLGAIHGISQDYSLIFVIGNRGKKYPVPIDRIGADYTQVYLNDEITQDWNYRKKQTAYVKGLTRQLLPIYILNADGIPEDFQNVFAYLFGEPQNYLVAVEQESHAQYVVQIRSGRYYLTYPNDPFRPLAEPISILSANALDHLANDLRHISHWEFLKNLGRTEGNTLETMNNQLAVECFQIGANGQSAEIMPAGNTFPIGYEKQLNGNWESSIQVKITNPKTNKTALYCAVLFLSSAFESSTEFLNPQVYLVKPGNSLYLSLKDSNSISFKLSKTEKTYNWPSRPEYFNLLVSNEPFELKSLTLPALSEPKNPDILR